MKTKSLMISTLSLLLINLLAACGADSGQDEGQEVTETPEPLCTEIQEVQCVDNLVLDLSLQNSVATTNVTTQRESENWVTFVDATAGGFGNSSNNPWITFDSLSLVQRKLKSTTTKHSNPWTGTLQPTDSN